MALLSRILCNTLVTQIMEILGLIVAFPVGPHSKGTCAKAEESQKTAEKLQVHYISNESQNEFIVECSILVKQHVLGERKSAKFYAIIVDSAPDLGRFVNN